MNRSRCKQNVRKVGLISAVLLAAIPISCRRHEAEAKVDGIWEVTLRTQSESGAISTYTTSYRFSGDDLSGTVRSEPSGAGFEGGEYAVSGERITFWHSDGHGVMQSREDYSGTLLLGLDGMSGSLTGQSASSGVIDSRWSGTFAAVKRE
jgi:hypothetical protein